MPTAGTYRYLNYDDNLAQDPSNSAAQGKYQPAEFITPNTFNTENVANDDPLFNNILLNVDNDFNQDSALYLPGNLPMYIPTLFHNVRMTNDNLKNNKSDIDNSIDNRFYPTCKAVKDFVNFASSGSEIVQVHVDDPSFNASVNGQVLSDENQQVYGNISGSVVNSVVLATKGPDSTISAFLNDAANKKSVFVFQMSDITSDQNGKNKKVINMTKVNNTMLSAGYVADDTVNFHDHVVHTELWCEPGSQVFLVLGKQYNTYQCAYEGEMLDMVQYNAGDNISLFIVNSYKGFFYNR